MFKTVLQVHNLYQQPGGEERVFELERDLLAAHGHRVIPFTIHNDTLKDAGAVGKAKAAVQSVWNRAVYRDLRAMIRTEKADIIHFHNTFPLISPAAYHAAKDAGIPVVQTLHNYRLMCANGFFFRQGTVCEACVGKTVALPALRHKCYRDGFLPTATVLAVNAFHFSIRTWQTKVDAYIALTDFAKAKFVASGLPAEKIHIKPNFLEKSLATASDGGDAFLFVGRLSEEKGIRTLLKAWERLRTDAALLIAGDGPLADVVIKASQADPRIKWQGRLPTEAILRLMGKSRALIFPSVWYEGFPVTIVEALSAGLPVIASDIGAMSTLIKPDVTGFHFEPGDADALAKAVDGAFYRPEMLKNMRENCRAVFHEKYSPQLNYMRLIEIYESAARTHTEAPS